MINSKDINPDKTLVCFVMVLALLIMSLLVGFLRDRFHGGPFDNSFIGITTVVPLAATISGICIWRLVRLPGYIQLHRPVGNTQPVLMLIALSFLFVYLGVDYANMVFDNSTGVVMQVAETGRYHHRTYYSLSVSDPEGTILGEAEVEVPESFYRAVTERTLLEGTLHKGAFGIPWISDLRTSQIPPA